MHWREEECYPPPPKFVDQANANDSAIFERIYEDKYPGCFKEYADLLTCARSCDQHGHLDVLVNNAGITIDRTVAKMSDEEWQRVLVVNLSGAFFIAQAALDHMIERGTGRVIGISSVIGETGNIGQANYAASKSGLFGLTKSLARGHFQLNRAQRPAGDGIGVTVNAVTPGYIATEMMATMPDKVRDRIRGQIPVGRIGRAGGDRACRLLPGRLTSLPTTPGRSGRQRRTGYVRGMS